MELIFLYLPPFPGRDRFSSVLFWFSFAEGLVLPSPWLPGCVSQAVGGTRIPGNQLNSFSVKVKGGTAFPVSLMPSGKSSHIPSLSLQLPWVLPQFPQGNGDAPRGLSACADF